MNPNPVLIWIKLGIERNHVSRVGSGISGKSDQDPVFEGFRGSDPESGQGPVLIEGRILV